MRRFISQDSPLLQAATKSQGDVSDGEEKGEVQQWGMKHPCRCGKDNPRSTAQTGVWGMAAAQGVNDPINRQKHVWKSGQTVQ